MKQLLTIFSGSFLAIALLLTQATPAYANANQREQCKDRGGVPVSTIWNSNANLGDECIGDSSQNPIFALLSSAIRWFSAIFGLILVLIVAVAGFQYIIAAGDSSQIVGAKERLKGAVTGLVLYLLMFSILQFLLPDGARVFR